jgi:hypothetical protein
MKTLYSVTLEFEGTLVVPVWAENEAEARRIAERDAETYDVDMEFSYSHADSLSGAKPEHWFGHGAYGEVPDGCPDDAGEALQWLDGSTKQQKAALEGFIANRTLFDGLDLTPLPCVECGERFPIWPHNPDCSQVGDAEKRR